MKLKNYIVAFFFGLLLFNCSNEEMVEEVSIIGEWELTEWRIGLEADINKDGVGSFNLLDEIDCNNREAISIDEQGNISIQVEHNPKIYITQNEVSQEYTYHLSCSEGVIAAIAPYTLSDNVIEAFDTTFIKDGNTLTTTIEYDVEIYNEDLTEALGILTSTKIYTKI